MEISRLELTQLVWDHLESSCTEEDRLERLESKVMTLAMLCVTATGQYLDLIKEIILDIEEEISCVREDY